MSSLEGEPRPPKCYRHDWIQFRTSDLSALEPWAKCARCGTIRDDARSKRGRTARARGNARERELAKSLGGKRVGHFGEASDVTTDRWSIQSKVRKAYPAWMSAELAKLPRTDGRVPILVVTDAPGPGIKRRSIVVMELADFRDLYGPVKEAA